MRRVDPLLITRRMEWQCPGMTHSFMHGTNHCWCTTKGWQLLAELKDGSLEWRTLADLKELHPIEVAKYAVNNKLVSEPVFAWWVLHVLKKCERIIKKVQKQYWKCTHKFGIELPPPKDPCTRLTGLKGPISGGKVMKRSCEMSLHLR
jgi:hypothetical protein